MSGPLRVLLLGGTGTIGRAVAAALVAAGHPVTALLRRPDQRLPGCRMVAGDVTEPGVVAAALPGAGAVISCLASRDGAKAGAWAVHSAFGHLRAETPAGIPARQAGLRGGTAGVGAGLDDHPPHRPFHVAVRPGRTGSGGTALPGVRRRPGHGLQADLGRRSGCRRGWPTRRNSPGSAATMPPDPCWSGTPRRAPVTPMPRRNSGAIACAIITPPCCGARWRMTAGRMRCSER